MCIFNGGCKNYEQVTGMNFMNTGICDCGRLRQISFQVATAVLEHRFATVPFAHETNNGACRDCENVIQLEQVI